MMITNNKINTFFFGVSDFAHSFYAAIERDYKLNTRLHSIIDSLKRNAIPFIVPIRNIIINIAGYPPKEFVSQRNCRCTIYIVIPVNKNPFFVTKRLLNPLDRF